MYRQRQGGSSNDNTQPPPWLVRAEVTIRHGTPVTTEPGQTPVGVTTTSTDSSGVRMVYRWSTSSGPPTSSSSAMPQTPHPSSSSSSGFTFQRGNMVFTSTPPPRPGSHTIPRSGSSGNEESMSSAGRGANVSDSGYYSEQFSPQSYSSLPSRRPFQQYNRRCKSTCSIVLSSVATETADQERKGTNNEGTSRAYDNSWRHHQHAFPRRLFSTVPEVCEDCPESGTPSIVHGEHSCDRVQEKVSLKTTRISKDASSQTTDIECRESTSTIASKSKTRRKTATGLRSTDEQKKKKDESRSPTSVSETTSVVPSAESERSDSSAKDDSSKRKSRTVHIDVYCTGTEDDEDENSDASTELECDTPLTIFENPDIRVTHTQAPDDVLPRGFQDDKAFLKRATERRCDSFRHAPMRMPSIASSKGYDSDDVLSSLYPSQFSSYSALRDLDSAPWSAASSNAGIPFDYDSTIATSPKDTLSDVESLVNSKLGLTPCDSFEYASSSDRERIRRLDESSDRPEVERVRQWRSPQIERKYLLQNRKMKEYLERHEIGWSSADSGEDSDESGTVGWSFVSSEESQRMLKKSSVRRSSKITEKDSTKHLPNVAERTYSKLDRSDSTTRSDSIPHPRTFRDQIGPFASNSPSPIPSKMPSRVTSPFMTPQGERTDHILKASIFGTVVNAFRKPGHHIGPSKNPSCSCEHCRRHFEELNSRNRSRSTNEFERQIGFRLENERRRDRSKPRNDAT